MLAKNKILILLTVSTLVISACASSNYRVSVDSNSSKIALDDNGRRLIYERPSPRPAWAVGSVSHCEGNNTERSLHIYDIGMAEGIESEIASIEDARLNARFAIAKQIVSNIAFDESTQKSVREQNVNGDNSFNIEIDSQRLTKEYGAVLLSGVSFPKQYVAKYEDPDNGSTRYQVIVCAKMSLDDKAKAEEWRKNYEKELIDILISSTNSVRNYAEAGQFISATAALQSILDDDDYRPVRFTADFKRVAIIKDKLLSDLIIESDTVTEQKLPINSMSEPLRAKVFFSYGGNKLPAQNLPLRLLAASGTELYTRSARTDNDGYVEFKLPEDISKYPPQNGPSLFRLDFDIEELQSVGIIAGDRELRFLEGKGIDYRFEVEDSILLMGNAQSNDFELDLDLEAIRAKYRNNLSVNNSNSTHFRVGSNLTCAIRCYVSLHGLSMDGSAVELLHNGFDIQYRKEDELIIQAPYEKRHKSFIVLASREKQFVFGNLDPGTVFSRHEFDALLKIFQRYDFAKSILHEKL